MTRAGNSTYLASTIKRRRRSKVEMETIRTAIYDVAAVENPMTVRQVFYRLVSAGVIDKTEAEYKSTVCRLLTEMRVDHDLPFNWIADNTRWMRKPRTFSSMDQALRRTAETYRRALWDNQDVYVEIWLEKEALAGVLYDVTQEWDVPLMVTRGYPSISFLYSAAESIEYEDKPAYLYYFGDWDPSGVDIPRNIEERLNEFAADTEIIFKRVAITPAQVEEMDLPTRPTKKSDTRSKNFKGASIEVDAIPPIDLRQMVEDCILDHVDHAALKVMQAAEQSEREILNTWKKALGESAGGEIEP